ncbi:hypothetical protein PMAYCL1PPCAC_29462, partial [Pristionchus mayeri]
TRLSMVCVHINRGGGVDPIPSNFHIRHSPCLRILHILRTSFGVSIRLHIHRILHIHRRDLHIPIGHLRQLEERPEEGGREGT